MHYQRPSITPKEAVRRLCAKGLIISDPVAAEKFICFVGYFRLRGFCLPFMQTAPPGFLHGSRIFHQGVHWDDVTAAYECDRQLRSLVFQQIERIEIAFRAVFVDHMAGKYGPHWYADIQNGFVNKALDHMDWLIDAMKEIKRSGEHALKSYFKNYKKPAAPPVWYAAESITFSKWSMLYKALSQDTGAIAKPFGVPPDVLSSWAHTLSVLRNMCAHHSRLFGKNLTLQPSTYRKFQAEFHNPNSLYTQLVVIRILTQAIDQNTLLVDGLRQLQIDFPNINFATHYGLPADWQMRQIWQ